MSLVSPTKLEAADDEPLSPTVSESNGDPVSHEEYSARMDEIMDDSDGDAASEDGFIYDGVDAPQLGYREQLREALSDDGDDDDEALQDEKDELRVEQIVGNGNGVPPALLVDDELASNLVCGARCNVPVAHVPRALNTLCRRACSCRRGRSWTTPTTAQTPQPPGQHSYTQQYPVCARSCHSRAPLARRRALHSQTT